MHARVTHFKGELTKLDEGIRRIKENVVPGAKKLPGFKGGYWFLDRKTGKGFGVTLFESEEAVRSSEEAAKQMREQAAAAGVTEITGVEQYEVVAQA